MQVAAMLSCPIVCVNKAAAILNAVLPWHISGNQLTGMQYWHQHKELGPVSMSGMPKTNHS